MTKEGNTEASRAKGTATTGNELHERLLDGPALCHDGCPGLCIRSVVLAFIARFTKSP